LRQRIETGWNTMKFIVSVLVAAVLAVSFVDHADAARHKGKYDIGREASCQWRAKKRYSNLHPLKRRAFIRECLTEPR
jgi:hypothetical protein